MATYLLVHGAWHGGWCWMKVVPLVRAAGHEVYTPTLTGLGERAHLLTPETDFGTHVHDILGVLEYEDLHGVVLVGHSYGGMVITAVAEQAAERLAHLVYLDAFVPQHGQSMRDLLDSEALAMYQEQAQTLGDGWRVPAPPLARFGVTQADDLRWMNPRVGVHPLKTFFQPVHLANPAAQSLARTYISCTVEQRPSFVATAKRVRAEAGWRYRELATGHDAMVTEPKRLADLLLEVIQS